MGCSCNSSDSVREKENVPTTQKTEPQETKVVNVQKNEDAKKRQPKKKQKKGKQNSVLTSFTEKNIDLERMRELELEEHNRLRALHGADPLILNPDLNEMAQKYAEILAKKKQMEHSKDRNLKSHPGEYVGENLYYAWASPILEYKCGDMSKSWYDEIKDYDFNTGKTKNGGVVGHFTQLVWKDTKEVGFGIGFNGDTLIAVANYYPGGNFNELELQNVGKLKN